MFCAATKLAERLKRIHVPAVRIAKLYSHAGTKEESLQWLEKAYEYSENPLVHLKVMWDWDGLRNDLRFQHLFNRMNFPE